MENDLNDFDNCSNSNELNDLNDASECKQSVERQEDEPDYEDEPLQEAVRAQRAHARNTRKRKKKYLIKNRMIREIVSWSITIIAAVFIAIIINTYFFRISKVSGNSMLQTYHDGDIVYISRAPYIFGNPDRNDIVIFDSELKPRNFLIEIKEAFKYNVISYSLFNVEQPTNYYIKRVIATGGDKLRIDESGVYVNDTLVDESYVYVPSNESIKLTGGRKFSIDDLKAGITIPENEVFVMGDNRNHSTDSRIIGCVPKEDIIGKVIGG